LSFKYECFIGLMIMLSICCTDLGLLSLLKISESSLICEALRKLEITTEDIDADYRNVYCDQAPSV
jgi:hypothetical protein